MSNFIDDDEEASYSASQCLATIVATIEAIETCEDIILSMEPVLLPIINRVLTDNGSLTFEYLDSVVHFVSLFTYNSTGITVTMWSVCGPMLAGLHDWAIDYITEFMTPLLNFITKDPANFLAGSFRDRPFVLLMMDSLEKVFAEKESYSGKDYSAAATLLSALVTSCKVKGVELRPLLPQILGNTLNVLGYAKSLFVKTRLMEVILASFYYDAAYTFSILESAPFQKTTAVFTLLFELLKQMERDFTMRLVVLSFTAILQLPPASMPEIVRGNGQGLFQQCIRELVLIEEVAKERAEKAARGEDSDYEDDEDDDFDDDFDDEIRDEDEDGPKAFDDTDAKQAAINRAKKLYVPEDGYGEDEDCLNAEDEDYREMLENCDKEDRVKRELYRAGEPVDDDEDDDDFEYTSEIENFDVTKIFFEAVTALGAQDAQLVANLQGSLDSEDQQRLQELFSAVQQRVAAAPSAV